MVSLELSAKGLSWRRPLLIGLDVLFVAGCSIDDLMGRGAYRTFMAWSLLTVCFLAVVGYLSHLRWRGLA